MKNLKKILLSLMVLFLAFAFIGCPAEPEVPETPVTPEPVPPVNNFKGKTFIGMEGEGEEAYLLVILFLLQIKTVKLCSLMKRQCQQHIQLRMMLQH